MRIFQFVFIRNNRCSMKSTS